MVAPSSPRGTAPFLWVAIHTMEGIVDADDAAAYFGRSSNSSAHAVADGDKLIEGIVPYSRAAWTLRNGNEESDNLELCAFAMMTRAQWLSTKDITFYHPQLRRNVTVKRPYNQLVHSANWIRSRCLTRGIPLKKITSADVAARRKGVIGHVNYTEGAKDGTHWDPGPGYPWDIVMLMVTGQVQPGQEEEDDVSMNIMTFEGRPSDEWSRAGFPIETRSKSMYVGDSVLSISSAFDDIVDMSVTFWPEGKGGRVFESIPQNKREWIPIPDGTESVAVSWKCGGPVGLTVVTGPRS